MTAPATPDVALLRAAAARIREVAAAATPGPWQADQAEIYGQTMGIWIGESLRVDAPGSSVADAAHIALWHPLVAEATANLLDAIAVAVEINAECDGFDPGDVVDGYYEAGRLALAIMEAGR